MTASSRGGRAGVRVALAAALVAVCLPTAAGRSSPPWPTGIFWHTAGFRLHGASPLLTARLGTPDGPAYVAWIDHTRTRLALYPGLREPPSARVRGSGEVPHGERWRLLATFNGGFKAVARAGGMVVNGVVDEPLRTGMGTLVAYRDGSVAILDWLGRTKPGELVLARQNLPPLVWAGRPAPQTLEPALWGQTLGGTTVWRSGVGVTRRGDLVYAAADRLTPATLAGLLIRLGAVRAIELDINPEWPTFIAYGGRGGRYPVKLVPNPQQRATRYLVGDARDFFAVYTRSGGGALVPFR